jgi:hypothetical protein
VFAAMSCWTPVAVVADATPMQQREETRHLVVADRQAVISPSRFLHAGVGTAAYSFVWAMAGENQAFDDMDPRARHRPAVNGPELLAAGETMAMIAPATGGRLADAALVIVDVGGAESNVAAHVAALGRRVGWYSRLGDDALGRRIDGQLTGRGVELTGVVFDACHPTGLYVKDPGDGVSYYRAGSAPRGSATSAARFLDAGARVVAVGSALEDPAQLGQLAELLRQRKEVA